MNEVVRAAVAGALGGALLQLAWPPVGAPALLAVAIVVVLRPLVVPRRASTAAWLCAGLTFGAAWWGILVPAVVSWGLAVQLTFLAMAIVGCAFAFGAAALLSPHTSWPPIVNLISAWIVGVTILEGVGVGTLSLTAALAGRSSTLHWPIRLFGGLGVDAGLWAVAALVAGMPGRRAAIGTVALGSLLWAAMDLPSESDPPGSAARLVAVQPALPGSSLSGVKFSMVDRRRVEATLESMTALSVREFPGALVIWPEGGARLPTSQLQDQRARLLEVVRPPQQALIAEHAIDESGRRLSSVTLLSDGGFSDTASKAEPVPFAEAYLAAAEPAVLTTDQGTLGILICFDSLFGAHARRLRSLGAEILIVTSDDESFGMTPLALWHQSISALRAAEVGLPMAFVSNYGPSSAFDRHGRRQPEFGSLGESRLVALTVPLDGAEAGFSLWWLPVGAAWAVFVFAAYRAVTRTHRLTWRLGPRVFLAAAIALPLAAAIGIVTTLGSMALRGDDPRVVWADWVRRATPPIPRDEIAPSFKQTSVDHCGAAALSYAMTVLGANVFESDVVSGLGPAPAGGYSLAELSRFAGERGFRTKGLSGAMANLRRVGGRGVIAHLQTDHFVSVLGVDAEHVLLFDPAVGRRLLVPVENFERSWSGRYLVLWPAADQ